MAAVAHRAVLTSASDKVDAVAPRLFGPAFDD